ncbi:MAG: HDOD domain-containing protein [Deltaproteobacteria bacterium]|nr:HDOD domain-containing protein [Deltaproteobacteria bacterium]
MSESLADIALAQIEGGRARIPVFDPKAARAQQMLAEGSFEIEELEALIAAEPALASALLRAANSTFFGGLDKVVSIHEGILRLGARRSAQLVVVLGQKQAHRMGNPQLQAMAERLWSHSLACALGTDWLVRRLRVPEIENAAMLAGLLHDTGKLFLLCVLDDLISSRKLQFEPTGTLVIQILAALHASLGARLLDEWRIPDPYRALVLHHHDEEVDESDALLLAVRLVDGVANKLGIGLEPRPDHDPAGTLEAQALRVPEVMIAELEIQLEDALAIES